VGNNKSNKQTNTIILGIKSNTKQKQVQNLSNKVFFNETFLKLTYNLQKTVNTISLIDYHYQRKCNNYSNTILSIEKLNDSPKSLLSKFFILTNDKYNTRILKNTNISSTELKYKLLSLNLKYSNNILYNNLKLASLLKYNVKLQKTVISNLSRNLMLSKENR